MPESLRLSRADFGMLLATHAASLVPNVPTFVFPLDLRGGDPLCGLHPILHINFTQAFALEKTLLVRLTLKVSMPGS